MLTFESVFEQFRVMSQLSPDECEPYTDLILVTITELEGKINPSITPDPHLLLLTQLAAAGAYYRYMVMTNMISANVSTLDLSVSIDNSKQILAAKRLRDEFHLMAKNLLVDDGFLFQVIGNDAPTAHTPEGGDKNAK